jgi:hypothetical protein
MWSKGLTLPQVLEWLDHCGVPGATLRGLQNAIAQYARPRRAREIAAALGFAGGENELFPPGPPYPGRPVKMPAEPDLDARGDLDVEGDHGFASKSH